MCVHKLLAFVLQKAKGIFQICAGESDGRDEGRRLCSGVSNPKIPPLASLHLVWSLYDLLLFR